MSIGRRRAPEGLVGLLGECHLRIRTFLRAASRLATSEGIDHAAAAVVATDVHRYFSNAFSLHLEDEDASIAPRLRGASPEVDASLLSMSADHVDHEADVASLVRICDRIREGEWSGEVAAELAAISQILDVELEAHLALEERVLFPAIAALAPDVQSEMLAEMRGRRERVLR